MLIHPSIHLIRRVTIHTSMTEAIEIWKYRFGLGYITQCESCDSVLYSTAEQWAAAKFTHHRFHDQWRSLLESSGFTEIL